MELSVSKIAQLSGHSSGVYAIAQGHDEHTVFTGSGDQFVAEWNIEKLFPEKFSVNVGEGVYSICHIAERNLLLVGQAKGGLNIIDLKEKKEIKHFVHHKAAIFDIQYSERLNLFITASADGHLGVWNATTFDLIRNIPLCLNKIRGLDFNQDHSLLAVACGDGLIRILETDLFNEVHTLKGHVEGSVYSVKFHPNLPLLLSGGKDAYLRFWNTNKDFEQIRAIPAHNFAIYSIVFSPCGKLCATGSRDKTIKIWDAKTFDKPHRIDRIKYHGHKNSINKLFWNKNPNRLISTGDDRTVIIWEVSFT
jgi:WD repeat-containing protein 61